MVDLGDRADCQRRDRSSPRATILPTPAQPIYAKLLDRMSRAI